MSKAAERVQRAILWVVAMDIVGWGAAYVAWRLW